jgi:uncharacterized protein YdeI (YjbR/CyaY-like superfamily)
VAGRIKKLRMIILDCGLSEELKWGVPCYTFQKSNIVLIHCVQRIEFQNTLDKIPALKTAFAALTPGRQRAYILYFSAPKQSKTRESRVEKCMQQILNGKGLND